MDKILVIDDEQINLMLVKRILEKEYEIHTAKSCSEALAMLRDMDPSLILLDIHMPEKDGYETFAEIREIERLKQVPIVFLTADDDSRSEVHGFELGADDFIRKPFVGAIVKRRVERVIEHFKLHMDLYSEVERQTEKARARAEELRVLTTDIIQTLTSAIDAKDIYTKGHSARVADYAVLLAQELGWSHERIEELYYKALLHDIGKIGVPDRILNKSGRLTDEEFAVIKSHTTLGSDLLKGVSSLADMYQVARSHHERFDGNGYPDRLKGEEIPEEARLVGIADAYDAMSSDRVYRKALSREVIRQELVRGRGTQFDPDMLDVFLRMFDENRVDFGFERFVPEDRDRKLTDAAASWLAENGFTGEKQPEGENLERFIGFLSETAEKSGRKLCSVFFRVSAGNETREELDRAMQALKYSISQSIPDEDSINRVTPSLFWVLLSQTEPEELRRQRVERIMAGFFKNCPNENIKATYEIR